MEPFLVLVYWLKVAGVLFQVFKTKTNELPRKVAPSLASDKYSANASEEVVISYQLSKSLQGLN